MNPQPLKPAAVEAEVDCIRPLGIAALRALALDVRRSAARRQTRVREDRLRADLPRRGQNASTQ
jgi:hypothetical protein